MKGWIAAIATGAVLTGCGSATAPQTASSTSLTTSVLASSSQPSPTFANDEDAAFIAELARAQVRVDDDPQNLIELGRGACAYLNLPGTNVDMAELRLTNLTPPVDVNVAVLIVLSAIDVYCPELQKSGG